MASSPTTPDVLRPAALKRSLNLVEVKPGLVVAEQMLRTMLPDVTTALFFAKLYSLDYAQLSDLLLLLFPSDTMVALLGEADTHSSELQDYLIETIPTEVYERADVGYSDSAEVPDTELLAQAVAEARVQVAASIQEVADKIGSVLDRFPTKYGEMVFRHLHRFDVQRRSIGQFAPQIQRQQVAPRLVVLDVSGSMSKHTVERIVGEVVGLAYDVDASMAIVSNNAYLWSPGQFTVESVLADAEYGGTHYEELLPIFHQDWETVITVADYDSDRKVKQLFKSNARGRVGQVLDFSLVNRPTFLAEVIGTIASEVTPVTIGNAWHVLSY